MYSSTVLKYYFYILQFPCYATCNFTPHILEASMVLFTLLHGSTENVKQKTVLNVHLTSSKVYSKIKPKNTRKGTEIMKNV